jgi:ferredoxin/flavodoxin---NADP+ reductase
VESEQQDPHARHTPEQIAELQDALGHVSDAIEHLLADTLDEYEDTDLDLDSVLALIGFRPDLGPLAGWGLDLNRNTIRVSQTMETNIPGVFAAGDIATYTGKLELIATGFAEAAIAVNHAVHHIDPKARVNPGHSTNLKVFKDREAAESVSAAGT